MSIKSAISASKKIKEMGIEGFMQDQEMENFTGDFGKEIEKNCETAKKVILESLSEGDFVKFVLMTQKILSTMSIMRGEQAILLAELEGSLQPYTQTVVLAVIGAFIEEEIL